jgi:hypothetical protein
MAMPELSLSDGSTSDWKAEMIKKALLSFPKNRLFKRARENITKPSVFGN